MTPITLRSIALHEIRMPLREPFRISSGATAVRRMLLLELTDADGTTAWSECVAGERPNYSPETIDTARLALRHWIAPRVLGRTFESPAAVAAELDRDFRGHRMAKAAVEMGVWGLISEREGVSLARLLGGTRDSIQSGISIGIQPDPPALARRVAAALEEGYRRIKVKIRPGADVEYVAAAREAAGADAPLMADANSAYSLEPRDRERLQGLDAYGLTMIEQPLDPEDLVRHAELQRTLETPICLDESITGPERARDMIALGSGRVVNIKPGRVGGFTAALAIHEICMEAGIPVWCGGMLESGIGRAYNVALASLPGFTIPGDVSPSARYWERDIVRPEWSFTGGRGRIRVPHDRPGLGVAVDADRISELSVHRELLDRPAAEEDLE